MDIEEQCENIYQQFIAPCPCKGEHCKHYVCRRRKRREDEEKLEEDPATSKERFCVYCRMDMFRATQEKRLEYEKNIVEKISQGEKVVDHFVWTGKTFFGIPASYEYKHLNTGRKFVSGKTSAQEAGE